MKVFVQQKGGYLIAFERDSYTLYNQEGGVVHRIGSTEPGFGKRALLAAIAKM